jgi:aspartyl-tRNA(Asn)/glutamyl-tRNA(Gln) amidotransferase subunit A
MIISYTEACSCHSNFTSIPFGKYNGGHEFNEIATNARKLLGDKVKEKNVIGAYFLNEENYEKMYLKAKKVRTVLKDL